MAWNGRQSTLVPRHEDLKPSALIVETADVWKKHCMLIVFILNVYADGIVWSLKESRSPLLTVLWRFERIGPIPAEQ
jgi:hypothetical protein